jgi:hypothetical protein
MGIAGFGAAVVMAIKATPTANDILDDLPLEATKVDKAKAVVPVYIPTAGMFMLSTGMVMFSQQTLYKRQAALMTLYSVSEASLAKWQHKVLEQVGGKKYEEIRQEVVRPEESPTTILLEGEGTLFFDKFSGRYFKAKSVEVVRQAVVTLNEKLYSDDFVNLNEFYYLLGLPPMETGDQIGWDIQNGAITARYDPFLYDDVPCVTISFEHITHIF